MIIKQRGEAYYGKVERLTLMEKDDAYGLL